MSSAKVFSIAIHGGAGVISKDIDQKIKDEHLLGLKQALEVGFKILKNGGTALDAVEEAVKVLEDNPLFNAGKGAVFNSEGEHELDASIMNGQNLQCGAVAGVKTVKNPISLARKVMEKSPHVLFIAEGAEVFAKEMGLELVENSYFSTEKRRQAWIQAKKESKIQLDHNSLSNNNNNDNNNNNNKTAQNQSVEKDKTKSTVGAVALDQFGNLAAATSTGGMTNKKKGRLGDSPIIGCGTYANKSVAISCTGTGEQFIRHVVAHDIAALVEYKNLSIQQAAEEVVFKKLEPDDGGIIGVQKDGSIALVFNSTGMFRGKATSKGDFEVAIWE